MDTTLFSVLFGLSMCVHCLQRYSLTGLVYFTENTFPAFGLHLPARALLGLHGVFLASAVAFALMPHVGAVWAVVTISLVLITAATGKYIFNHPVFWLFELMAIRALWGDWVAGGDAVRGLLQALVLLTYFLAGFHKLNRGFLMPSISFSLSLPQRYFKARKWRRPELPPRLAKAVPWMVIGGETLLPLAMLHPATMPTAFVLLVLMTVTFSLVGPQDFSMTMLAGLALFLPPVVALPLWGWAVLALATGTLTWLVTAPVQNRPIALERIDMAVVFGAALYLLTQAFLGAGPRHVLVAVTDAPVASAIVLGLYLFNAACPYLGLKLDGSMAMFANLRPDVWDHLVVPRPLRLAVPRYLAIERAEFPEGAAHREWANAHLTFGHQLVLIGFAWALAQDFKRRFPGQPFALVGRDTTSGVTVRVLGAPGECRWYEHLCVYPVLQPRIPAERIRRRTT